MTAARQIIEALLHQHTPVTFQACGPSMNPSIRDGQCLRVLPAAGAQLKPGSVVLYRIHDRMAVHRLIRFSREHSRLYVAADAALRGGEWIPAADLLGIVEAILAPDRTVRLDTRRARWAGRLRYATRPLRRLGFRILGRPAP